MAKNAVTMDLSVYNRALSEWAAFVIEDSGEVVVDEARLLYTDAMNLTPPWGAGRKRGSTMAAKLQGENAIERSMLNSFRAIGDIPHDPGLKDIVDKGSVSGLDAYLTGTKSKYKAARFSESQHESNRKRGRVHRSKNKLVIGSDVQAAQSSIERRKRNVGTYKAAWAAMAKRMGEHSKAKTKARIPAWVSRNIPKARGLIITENVSITKNSSTVEFGAVSHEELAKSFNRAVVSRIRSMQQKVKLMVDGQSKKINTKFRTR